MLFVYYQEAIRCPVHCYYNCETHLLKRKKGFKNDSGILKLGFHKIVRNVCFHERTYVQRITIGVNAHISCKVFFIFIINVYVWFSLLIYTARILILNTVASAKIFLLHN